MRVPGTKLWAGEPGDSGELVREFLIADVFTGTPLEGNQLGIFPDGRGLSDEMMLKTTREMNFAETVFFLPPAEQEADAHVRIFTPGGELPFAGHPTLGSAWVLGAILGKQAVTLPAGSYPGQSAALPSVGSWSYVFARPGLPEEQGYLLAKALHKAEKGLGEKLDQARETTSANTVSAAPRRELIHPGVAKYLKEAGLLP